MPTDCSPERRQRTLALGEEGRGRVIGGEGPWPRPCPMTCALGQAPWGEHQVAWPAYAEETYHPAHQTAVCRCLCRELRRTPESRRPGPAAA